VALFENTANQNNGNQGGGSSRSSNDVYLAQFFIKHKGSNVAEGVMNDIIEIEVENNLHLPDMFTIHLHNSELKWADTFKVGDAIEISAQASKQAWRETTGNTAVLMEGEITGLEPDLGGDVGIPTLLIRGYDRAYRLHQGKYFRSFLEMTDAEIVAKIAGDASLQAETTNTSIKYEHITQNNQTNMEFLLERAKAVGYQLYVDGTELHFHPGNESRGDGPTLEWGMNLVSFRSVQSLVHQVAEVVVRGWDPITKREIVGNTSGSDSAPKAPVSGTKPPFKGSDTLFVSRPVVDRAAADKLAQSLKDELEGEMVQAEGLCMGNPEVKAGWTLELKGLSEQFNGKYLVTAATHTYNAAEGYQTHFRVGGRKPDTLASLLRRNQNSAGPGQGVLVGLVTNNQDKENLGRIKVKYPGLDDDYESPWVRVAAPMAGAQRGFYYLPEVDDEVLIAFEQGDINRPYMIGALWNGRDKPPEGNSEAVSGGKVNHRLITSRLGHVILLDDTQGAGKVTITTQKGHSISLDDSGQGTISITTKGGRSVVLDDDQQKMTISDKGGNTVTAEASGMSLETKGSLSIKAGPSLSIEASGSITIKGAMIDLN
jgi:phage protein D